MCVASRSGEDRQLVDDHHSICEVAGRLGIFCDGFKQWSTADLRRRFDWIVERRPHITREELERLANIWELARGEVHDLPLACDVQAVERDTCFGWDEFTNDQLRDFLAELGWRRPLARTQRRLVARW